MRIRIGIKAKQVVGVTSIVGTVVVILSLVLAFFDVVVQSAVKWLLAR